MNGASWSSWQSAAELPDRDEPEPYGFEAREVDAAPGVFEVWFRSGWGRTHGRTRRVKTGLSLNLATAIAGRLDSAYRDRLNDRWRAEAEAEDRQRFADEASAEAYYRAMDEVWAAEAAEMAARPKVCDWCGKPLATYPNPQVCKACEDGIYGDVEPFSSEDIPW